MQPSPACYDLIKRFEGLRLDAYQDVAGICTIGWGHTGKSVRMGDRIDESQAEAYLNADVTRTACQVLDLFTIQPTQNQLDALTCFAFNVGIGNLSTSTLLRKLKSGDIQGAANEFSKWVIAGGEPLPGLVARRQAERSLFLGNQE